MPTDQTHRNLTYAAFRADDDTPLLKGRDRQSIVTYASAYARRHKVAVNVYRDGVMWKKVV